MEQFIRILFLAANPKDTDPLRLSEEIRTIEERLRAAEFRERFQLIQYGALRKGDLIEAMLRHQPHIVHFSGHGNIDGEIILEDDFGESQPLSTESFSSIFRILSNNIRCVVLNACHTRLLAESITQYIDFVISMPDKIEDAIAINFARGFYRALGYGQSIKTAFELGGVESSPSTADKTQLPALLVRQGVDPSNIRLFDQALVIPPLLTDFSVETLKNNQMIRSDDLPLTIEGQYSISGNYASSDLGVWVILQDSYGHFYIQNPRVSFLPENRWIATNILPGEGIEFVHFVRVTEKGHLHFQEMVKNQYFGGFDDLPAENVILKSIRISRV